MPLIPKKVTPYYQLAAAPTAFVTGQVAGEQLGVKPSELLMPNLLHSASIGVMTGATLVHHGGLQFGGMFGYKTLFTGVRSAAANATIGNVVLSGIEMAGRAMWSRGIQSSRVASMMLAREVGLHGMMTSRTFATVQDALKYSKEIRTTGNAGGTLMRFAGGLGDKVDDVAHRVVRDKVGNKVFQVMAKNSTKGGFLMKFAGGAALGTAMSAISWATIPYQIMKWMAGNAVDRFAPSFSSVQSYLKDNRNQHMGQGYLPGAFSTQQASTERQRALQAVYGSKVNPANRMFGNEAAMMHR